VIAERNAGLIAAGWMSVAASLLHLACIIGGPDWYRFFGAGEVLAQAAERGSLVPGVMTLVIAAILAVWALFAFGAAGIGWRPPFARTALTAIATVLLARAAMAFAPAFWPPENQSTAFIITTSAICFVMGACFAVGTWRAWPQLSKRI
jgi:heme/copper-type cytochrome/quinol oxidase subunit 3